MESRAHSGVVYLIMGRDTENHFRTQRKLGRHGDSSCPCVPLLLATLSVYDSSHDILDFHILKKYEVC